MDHIDEIRAFTRFYTRHMGLLSRDYPGQGLSVGAARVLYEIEAAGSARARDMARGLALDEGYLSRIVARFVKAGWVARAPVAHDGRAARLSLTAEGAAVMDGLHRKARADVAARLGHLSEAELGRVAGTLGRAERLMAGTAMDPGADVALRDLGTGDIGWIVRKHAESYAESDGFDVTFESTVARILADFAENRRAGRERAFVPEGPEGRLGSMLCVQSDTPDVAQIRLFYLVPGARGLGLGQRLMDACLAFARAAGYAGIRLWTHESHRAAGALYARNGFAMRSAVPARHFGRDVVVQHWDRRL